jgi:competence protein ComEC
MALFVLICYALGIFGFLSKSQKNNNIKAKEIMNVIIVSFFICLMFFVKTKISSSKYETLYEGVENVSAIAKVISYAEEKDYTNKYIVKIEDLSRNYNNTKLIVYVSKENALEYGDYIQIDGEFEKASTSRNDKGFDYQRYLRQNKIYGILYAENVKVLKHTKNVFYYIYKLKEDFSERLENLFNEEESAFLKGILLGDKNDISDDIIQNFRDSSLSHILAISGMHVVYVVWGVKFVIEKIIKNMKIKEIILIVFLIFFMIFTGRSTLLHKSLHNDDNIKSF